MVLVVVDGLMKVMMTGKHHHDQSVIDAQQCMYEDMQSRWVDQLDADEFRYLAIARLLDPRLNPGFLQDFFYVKHHSGLTPPHLAERKNYSSNQGGGGSPQLHPPPFSLPEVFFVCHSTNATLH